MRQQEKGSIDIHLLEESRTDQDGNEEYKKLQMVIQRTGSPKQLVISKWLLPVVMLIIFLLIVVGRMQEQEPMDVSKEEFIQMIRGNDELNVRPVSDLFEP